MLEHGSLFLDEVEALGPRTQSMLLEFLARIDEVHAARESSASPVSQPWNGQLISGSEQSLQISVRDRGFDPNLAFRLERVRIVLDPEQAGPGR
jgi:DNA-binding NtrC family response regulator